MMKYFIDENGNYIGGFDGAQPPEGAIEVPEAPAHAAQKWNGAGWDAVPEAITAAENLIQSDKDMLRAIDDLINTLKTKGYIVDADLPQAAQDKLAARAAARGKL